MEALKDDLSELEFGSSAESFQKYLDSQRELFHSQIDQLRNIVVAQCKLTGANPLSQEMAAGALSIKIGKRPRDLLNPKAVAYMQSVFSIKDAISKKESRDISALFGVTVTQVKDFFNSQRSRVRKLVRLSREKASRSNACKESLDGVLTSSDSMMPIAPVPLNSVGPASAEEEASCSTQDEALPGTDDSDKHFVENIFNLMRKEETFSGQMKLMEWILQMQNTSVLYWFLTKGGVMILASWLSEAAIEEQTSVLIVILKVLCHLPLHKALPVHISAILQSVNRLRFYKASDISNRAKLLLTRWSKMFARSQAMKKLNGTKSSSVAQKEITLEQSIGELMGDESWQSNIDIPEDILASSFENSENIRKLESPQALKLLTASSDDPSRKNILGVSASQIRGRRKVQLVEQPGQKSSGRSSQVTRAQSVIQGRPMSADDIQKAKMRAQFMQSKYGKTVPFSNEIHEEKPEGSNKSSIPQASILIPGSKVPVQPKIEEHKKPVILTSNISNRPEPHFDQKPKMDLKEVLLEECKRVQIPWLTPAEVKLNNVWRVGAGENSKEVEVQKNRNRRDKEPIYQTVQEIPFNPKEPWDLEMDYDDTLTPIIPIEQPPDADNAETSQVSPSPNEVANSAVPVAAAPASSQVDSGSATEPDLELLAVLLKNPELVFALTSDQAGNLSGEDTVKLLDMIKAGGVGLSNNQNRLDRKEEKVEVSLPSPTPSTNPGTAGGRAEATRNRITQQSSMANRVAYAYPGVTTTVPTVETLPAVPHGNIMLPTQPATAPALPRHYQPAISSFSMPQTSTMGPEKQAPSMVPSLHHRLPANSPIPSEVVLTMKNSTISNRKPTPVPIALNASERPSISYPLHPFLPMPTSPQQSLSGFWRDRQGFTSNPRSQANQNNYNTSLSGPAPWERNDYMDDDGFESWSPDNSPARAPEYMMGRNFPEPRMNMNSGRDFREDRSRQRDSPGYRDHNNRNNNRRWRDRRH